MKPRNCIEHSCNRAMREPVYVVLRPAAKRRPWPHVVTVGPAGLQSFSPGAPSPHPIDVALRGYPGVEWDKDMADVRAWKPAEILSAAWMFALGVTAWWLQTKTRKLKWQF